jgi:hypothetical protein
MKNEAMVKSMSRSGDYRFTYIYHYLVILYYLCSTFMFLF